MGRVTVTSPGMVMEVGYSTKSVYSNYLFHTPRSYLSHGDGVGAMGDGGGLRAVGHKAGDNLGGDGGHFGVNGAGDRNHAAGLGADGGGLGGNHLLLGRERGGRAGDERSRSSDGETHVDCVEYRNDRNWLKSGLE